MSINGLTNEEVKIRIKQGKVNYDTTSPSKSVKQILFENIFTLFNFINIFLGVLVILVGSYKNLLFLGVVVCNTLISTIQELRAKKTVDRLSVISSFKVNVIRDKKQKIIHVNDIVIDDVVKYELGNQIITDSKIIDGECEVDESFITGEAKTIFKKKGDILLSGSFIVSGSVYSKVIHIGLDNYTSKISYDAKKMAKEVNSEIMRSLNKIVKYVSIALIPIGILLLLRQFSIEGNTTSNAVVSVVAAIIGMIPEGLILLVSTVLAISTVRLSKKNVLVQDLYCIETLARVDTLCLDKTGTITEGKMEVSDVIPLNNKKINDIDYALEAISTNLDDNNPTFKAINEKYKNDSQLKSKKNIPFSSERKYSGVIFKDFSYIMGAPEFILSDYELKKIKSKIDEVAGDNRVLLVVKINEEFKDIFNAKKEVLGLVLIKDKIRSTAKTTLEYFKDNDVNIKIISGDSKDTVVNIAKRVGILIDGVIDGREITKKTNLNLLVEENNIFARIKPDQKKMIIKALKENNHIVAMTGDGVNDVLALKESDCAIAMNSGSDAARNVSELVLLDSDFDSMPSIVKEGRRTINNVERSATLFLSKTIYASSLALLFLFINHAYPFIPIQMSLINSLTIGIPAFILALEPNHNRVKERFFTNVISKAIPSGVTTVINILLLVFLSSLLKIDTNQTSTIAVIITAYTALLLIYKISIPFNNLRRTLFLFIIATFSLVYVFGITRSLYSLEILKPTSVLVLFILILVATKIFDILNTLINIFVKKKSNWFI